MGPVITKINTEAAQPYNWPARSTPPSRPRSVAVGPIGKAFMLKAVTRDSEHRDVSLRIFGRPQGLRKSPRTVPLSILVPSFVHERAPRPAFPDRLSCCSSRFVIIDPRGRERGLMSMGMIDCLSPVLISPAVSRSCLFVLIDGWSLIMGTLAQSFL